MSKELTTKLADLRAHGRLGLKTAAIGGDPESGFESSFASLAFIYIRDKAPALLDYMVGFQLVDRNDDNTKAVGIFGFKLDNQWVYAPVFFLNGDLKGHELLYLKDQDTFVPMKENWINYLVSKQPTVLGKPTNETPRDMGVQQPNLYDLSNPPSEGKFASARVLPKIEKWAERILPNFAQWCCKSPNQLEKFAGLDERLNLPAVLSADFRMAKLALDSINAYPAVKQAFDDYYGTSVLGDVFRTLREQILKQASPVLEARVKTAAATTPKKVEVISDNAITENVPEMNDQERERLLRDGYLIRDHRDGEEVSKAYNVQISQSLTNPDATDVYEVLVRDGKFEKCLVIHNPHCRSGRSNEAVVVRLSDKQWCDKNPANLFIRHASDDNKSPVETYRDWFDSLSDKKSLSEDAQYVLVADNGHGTGVFQVERDLGDGYYEVYWRSRVYGPPVDTWEDRSTGYFSVRDRHDCDCIVFNEREGASFKSVGGKLFVPPNTKVIEIKGADKCRSCSKTRNKCTCDYFRCECSEKKEPIKPGNLADLQMQILQKTAELKIWHDHNEVVINRDRMPKMAGLFHLVREHGFTERAAKRMLKESERQNGKRYRVKYAQPYPGQYDAMQGPGAPAMPEQEMMAAAPEYGNVPMMPPQEEVMPVPEMAAYNTDPETYSASPEALPDPGAMQTAQQAAQTGQKEVFDASMISGLLNSVQDSSLVERYLGDLMKALDRLGRIYFLFLWHNDEFMDRYGKADLPELEDALRNSFEGLGDLVLFLRAKSVSPLEGTGELGEPSVDNAALN